jgi:hypothetical protein
VDPEETMAVVGSRSCDALIVSNPSDGDLKRTNEVRSDACIGEKDK